MSETISHLPVLDLYGSPQQMGESHGESRRSEINEYATVWMEWILNRSAVPLDADQLWQRWEKQVQFNQDQAPELIDEMHGIARGSNVPFHQIFLLNSLLDISNIQYLKASAGLVGCSTFAVEHESGSGDTILGQTYDLPTVHKPHAIVIRLHPENGPAQLIFSFDGVIGCAGLNELGIGININYLSSTDTGTGKLHSVIVRKVLASQTLADAIIWPIVPPRCGGSHYLLGNDEGNLLSVEVNGQQHSLLHPNPNGILFHTNHYLKEELLPAELIRKSSIGSSVLRYMVLEKFFNRENKVLSQDVLMNLMRDHTSYPRSICSHETDSADDAPRSCTIAAMIQSLNKRTMRITNGCACESEFHEITLS